ncbi:MAG: glycosyltransferase family 8 protein [Acholeplasmatales bacterium]|jgi:lipopolysaccharide biosynthesis glycosyltransferase|nr:glycosyltransferase family 8 protein [Acholeplasmatales bacterium]
MTKKERYKNESLNIEEHIKKEIPIFFASDDNYIKFLAVTLSSLKAFVSDVYYTIYILYSENSISQENKEKIYKYQDSNIKIYFYDITKQLDAISNKLFTRDYYSKTTYYRLFIPNIFLEYEKAIYLDCDVVLNEDIVNMFNIELNDNLLAAVSDEAVSLVPEFRAYTQNHLGIHYTKYFNAGVLLMNLEQLRKYNFETKFIDCINNYKFRVAQDQDYLNVICKDRVLYLPLNYNKMPFPSLDITEDNVKIVHYNLSFKPWHYDNIEYQRLFWKYAESTEFFDEILEARKNYTKEDVLKDDLVGRKLIELAASEANKGLYNK